MLKIVKGNIKFYPGWKIDPRSSIEAPNLSNVAEQSIRSCSDCPPLPKEQGKCSCSDTFNAFMKDTKIDSEIRKEIIQLMPYIDDQERS